MGVVTSLQWHNTVQENLRKTVVLDDEDSPEGNKKVTLRLGICVHYVYIAFSALTQLVGGRKGIRPVKKLSGVIICRERGADLHMAQVMPLPLTVSCWFYLSGTGSVVL